jgi:hypothetical protein
VIGQRVSAHQYSLLLDSLAEGTPTNAMVQEFSEQSLRQAERRLSSTTGRR